MESRDRSKKYLYILHPISIEIEKKGFKKILHIILITNLIFEIVDIRNLWLKIAA